MAKQWDEGTKGCLQCNEKSVRMETRRRNSEVELHDAPHEENTHQDHVTVV